jgi:catechol 2,3-dioxygenase-like lactoylglutathione lyase family enzyme
MERILGLHHITAIASNARRNQDFYTKVLGLRLVKKTVNFDDPGTYHFYFGNETGAPGKVSGPAIQARAWPLRKDDTILMDYREKILKKGLNITPRIDRDYFFSLYFREPGGVLFELATDNPGFTRDEALNELGMHLKLPQRYEPSRAEIEAVLPRPD